MLQKTDYVRATWLMFHFRRRLDIFRRLDIIRRFMHNSSDARLDWILTSTAHILISPTISCSHPSYRNHL